MFRTVGLSLFLLMHGSSCLASYLADANSVPWTKDLSDAKQYFFYVCGNKNIQLTKKSLNRDFAMGAAKDGYVFTKMLTNGEYFSILKNAKLDDAKAELTKKFAGSHLWRQSPKGLVDLGAPTKIDTRIKATIKDCVEGSVHPSGYKVDHQNRLSICSEKIMGPVVYYGEKQQYVLHYTPDPSIAFKVPGEKSLRFCNFQEHIELKGPGR